jgi:hypothetical protein
MPAGDSGAGMARPRQLTLDPSARRGGRNKPRIRLGLGNAPSVVIAPSEPQLPFIVCVAVNLIHHARRAPGGLPMNLSS